MADDLPIQPVLAQSPGLQNPDFGVTEGGLAAHGEDIGATFMNTAGAQLVERGVNEAYVAMHGGNQTVPYDKAVQMLKQGNYDASGVPKDGWSEAALMGEMQRQQRAQDQHLAVSRANLSGVSQFVDGLVGGLGDPITLAAGPALGRVGALADVGKVGRAAVGAAEGAGLVGGEEALQNHLVGHDEDSLSWTMLRDVTLSAAPGALLHAAFGAKAMARPGEPMTPEVIADLEGSAAYAKAHGIASENDVVSPAGAVGKYQIMPATARGFGLHGTDAEITEQLKDPTVNAEINHKLLDQLARQFGNDPEAIAVAYNAGPRWAERWKAAGRDDGILPKETQGYLSRLRGVPYQQREDAARLALGQLQSDSPADVEPVAEGARSYRTNAFSIRDEHDLEVQQLVTQAMQDAVPKHGSMFERFADPSEILAQEAPKNPELEAYQGAQQAAEERIAGLGPEAHQVYKDELAEQERTPEVGTLQHDEVTKGVQAAVNCGIMKGLTYGAD